MPSNSISSFVRFYPRVEKLVLRTKGSVGIVQAELSPVAESDVPDDSFSDGSNSDDSKSDDSKPDDSQPNTLRHFHRKGEGQWQLNIDPALYFQGSNLHFKMKFVVERILVTPETVQLNACEQAKE